MLTKLPKELTKIRYKTPSATHWLRFRLDVGMEVQYLERKEPIQRRGLFTMISILKQVSISFLFVFITTKVFRKISM